MAQDSFNGLTLSTVFLVVDHSYGNGPPVLFETMVFADEPHGVFYDGIQKRYCGYHEALRGHEQLKQGLCNAILVNATKTRF